MPKPDEERGDNAMLWFNLVGICLVTALLSYFFWNYGTGFLTLLMLLFAPEKVLPEWP